MKKAPSLLDTINSLTPGITRADLSRLHETLSQLTHSIKNDDAEGARDNARALAGFAEYFAQKMRRNDARYTSKD